MTSSISSKANDDASSRGAVREALAADGHVTIDELLPPELIERLRERIGHVLNRQYETGVFPDECYYRPGTTFPNVPRHVVNAWKCDRRIAAVAASAELAEIAAEIFGWPSMRLAVDTLWEKPSGAIGIDYHQEFEYFTSLDRAEVASCWIALDSMSPDNGTLEFATGSHRWPNVSAEILASTFADRPGRDAIETLAAAVGESLRVTAVNCAPGGCTFFDGRIWLGSGPNASSRERRAIGIHWIRGDTTLNRAPTYLFGRYKMAGSSELHDSFFPLVWSETGDRSPWIDRFVAGGPLGG